MALDAVFPAASELVMVYAGALASGAIAGADVTLFGAHDLLAGVGVRRDGPVGDDRLHGRRDRRLGDRPLRRTAAARAPRPLVPPRAGAARAGGALVRALGRLGRLPGALDAGRPLLLLDPGRCLPHAARPLHGAHARRIGDLVLRARRRSATRSAAAGTTSTTASGTWTTSCSPWCCCSPAMRSGAGGRLGARSVQPPI